MKKKCAPGDMYNEFQAKKKRKLNIKRVGKKVVEGAKLMGNMFKASGKAIIGGDLRKRFPKKKIDPYKVGRSIRTAPKRTVTAIQDFSRGLTGKPRRITPERVKEMARSIPMRSMPTRMPAAISTRLAPKGKEVLTGVRPKRVKNKKKFLGLFGKSKPKPRSAPGQFKDRMQSMKSMINEM